MTTRALPKPSKDNKQIQEYVAAAKRGLDGYCVTKTPAGYWSVKKVRNNRASGLYETKDAAVKRAKEIAKNQKSEVFVFDAHGDLPERKAY